MVGPPTTLDPRSRLQSRWTSTVTVTALSLTTFGFNHVDSDHVHCNHSCVSLDHGRRDCYHVNCNQVHHDYGTPDHVRGDVAHPDHVWLRLGSENQGHRYPPAGGCHNRTAPPLGLRPAFTHHSVTLVFERPLRWGLHSALTWGCWSIRLLPLPSGLRIPTRLNVKDSFYSD